MNLNEMKLTNNNIISLSDSLNAPILGLNIKNTQNTTIPNTNELIIYVDKTENASSAKKTYIFNLTSSLKYLNEESDEFIIEPQIINNKVIMKTYVKRKIIDNVVADEAIIEELDTQVITLFEGVNYLYTNYSNANIEIVYPKTADLMLYFLNNAIYENDTKNKILSFDDIYFKDCFTEVENGINAEFNKATIKCMDSINQKFSLDCDGNLVVNSITTTVPINSTSSAIDFNLIYPVGSIYLSTNSVNPNTLFGGTWEQIKDRFLLASGDIYYNESIGGDASHILSINEMPNHKHYLMSGEVGGSILFPSYSGITYDNTGATEKYGYATITTSTGGTQAHNNMPPYLAVNIWKRIS